MASPRKKIKLVLFDAFDTLIYPKLPIHVQYTQEAHKAGLISLKPDDIRAGFKKSFPSLNKEFPLYGRAVGMAPEVWWTKLISETMIHAGASSSDVASAMPQLGPSLLERFASNQGYNSFEDVIPALKALKEMDVKTAVLSNADPRILKVFDSLDITPHFTCSPTLNTLVGISKPSPEIFHHACRSAGVDFSEAAMVGDELDADYHGAEGAGLHALLLRREEFDVSDGAKRELEEELEGVSVVHRLEDVVTCVKWWNEVVDAEVHGAPEGI